MISNKLDKNIIIDILNPKPSKDMVIVALVTIIATLLMFFIIDVTANYLNEGVWFCGNGVVGEDPCYGGKIPN